MRVLPEPEYVALRCKSCSAIFAATDVTEEYLSRLYATESEAGVEEIAGVGAHGAIIRLRLPEFHRNWDFARRVRHPVAGDRLLDVGCQTGEFGLVAAVDGVSPYGVEMSADYAKKAMAAWDAPEGNVYTGRLDDAPFPAGYFSYVTAFETLEHMVDPIKALKRIRWLVAEDGVVVVSVPAVHYFILKGWLLRLLNGRTKTARRVIPHTHIYTFSRQALIRCFEGAGLTLDRLSVTGWHGRCQRVLNVVAACLAERSGGRVLLAPSLLAVARPTT